MSIQIQLRHFTQYRYDHAVMLSPQVIRLRPAAHTRTPILGYSLKLTPQKHYINWQQDPQGNFLARVVVPEPVREFSVEVSLTADLVVVNPFDFFLEPSAEHYPFPYEPDVAKDLRPYLETLPATPLVDALVASIPTEKQRTIDFLVGLNQRIAQAVRYLIRLEPGVQSPEETLQSGSGSCRDSAWLLVQVLRRIGIAARFVSGYLVQLAADQKSLDGPSGPEQDFTDLHAWCEAYLPGAGWVGFDATSGLLAGEGHIPLAATPDPQSAAPISGGVEKSDVEFHFEMQVSRLPEAPRSTRPYDEETWSRIEALGHHVDQVLQESDTRLTLGGEPTFVSIDDFDSPEWNTAALGPGKRKLAGELLHRLRNRFAPGGFLHFGLGKQYPGETLPRWALSCFWRRDGVPIWEDPGLVVGEQENPGHGATEARRFLWDLADRLGVSTRNCMPGFEDAWYWLWRERRLPTNVDPFDSRLADPEERARIAHVFDQGLPSVVGYALPLRHTGNTWQTGAWLLRRERMYLIPGDSPMGFRLPLDSLPWTEPMGDAWQPESDPLVRHAPLPLHRWQRYALRNSEPADQTPWDIADTSAPEWVVRTALCVEPRGGILHVFFPPLSSLEAWIELAQAVEETARETGLHIRCEGYPPPRDPRLLSFAVTPDPGVIEVNVQPVDSWRASLDLTLGLYEEARHTRLGTEKFLIDGRRAGTGGGNHIVLGGATPADSPFLRRPSLLRSMLTHWLNHPSLSYLFSGLFIGPTSQAPRVDEARNDAVHELELAFSQLSQGEGFPPWMVDRALRHILTDVTGNTHRTEFCIDKLYSPDSSSGRLGLVELRNFEMPPHPRMSLAQQLLVRALVARFWNHPIQHAPVRWGAALHDRWMLPYFLWQDLREVVEDLRDHGFAFELEWFRPHFEFRCPAIGTMMHSGLELEIRSALEPWHVLGEEPSGGGTTRYVDSSLERLQVLVRNSTPGRWSILCNGMRLPLTETGVVGEFIAAVRFRAWQPPSCLHPMIGTHSPLLFDLYDEWSGRAIKGCTYHVMHPGGRAYERFPVNGNEAEARRFERFQPIGHTPGIFAPHPSVPRPEAPLTLDLRWS